MAYGLPVVTSQGSACEEVAGGAALLVHPSQTGEIASALNQLIDDEVLRTKLSLQGSARAQLYTWERAVRATRQTYEEVEK